MNIGPDAVQVGVVTFGFTGTSNYYLYNTTTRLNVMNQIASLPTLASQNSFASISNALQEVINNQFVAIRGDRPLVPNVVVLVTSLPANLDTNVEYQTANTLKARGVQVYTVGMNTANPTEIRNISSSPYLQNFNYFQLTSDVQLPTIVDSLYTVLCPPAGCPGKLAALH